MLLISFQALFNNRIGSFANDEYLALWVFYDHRHAFSSAVKLNYIEEFVTAFSIPSLTDHITFIVTRLKHKSKMARTIDEGKLIWRTSIVYSVILLCLLVDFSICDNCVTKAECL